jgi:hypothetical protein
MSDPTDNGLAFADNPTMLRWGLNDVLWGDDDTVTILLSDQDRNPYWLELEPETAAVMREDLAGPPPEKTPDDQTALRDRIAEALLSADTHAQLERRADRERFADAALAALPPAEDRAALLLALADEAAESDGYLTQQELRRQARLAQRDGAPR